MNKNSFKKNPLLIGLMAFIMSFSLAYAYDASDTDYTTPQNPVQDPDSYDETPEEDIVDGVCEGRSHEYTFRNTSTNSTRYKYWAAISGYAIVFDDDPNYTAAEDGNPATDDFLTTVDTSSLLCTDGAGTDADGDGDYDAVYQDCGFDVVSDLGNTIYSGTEWGGTTVTYQELDFIDGSPRGLIWEYAQTSGTVNDVPWLEANEWWYTGGISMEPFADSTTDLQTATTTNWVFVEYWVQDTKNTIRTSDDDWSKVYAVEVDADNDGVPDDSTWDPDGDGELWWGITDVNRSIWPACAEEEEEPVCETLTVTPAQADISVDHLNGDPIDFNATVIDSDGDDITSDSDLTFKAFAFGTTGAHDGTADANGDFRYGFRDVLGRSNDETTAAGREVSYYDPEAGDSIFIKVDGTEDGICEVELELPYCYDLNLTNPTGNIGVEDEFNDTLTIEVEASNGEDWPYDVTWETNTTDGTFDGNTAPYTDDFNAGIWEVDFVTAQTGRVDVSADDDVAGLCSDNFKHVVSIEPVCEEMLFLEGPYTYDESGAPVAVDETDDTSIQNMYDLGRVCYRFSIDTSDEDFTANLIAEANSGSFTIALNDNSVGPLTSTGNPASLFIGGLEQYTGELCWDNFDEGDNFDLYVDGADSCEIDDTLPTITDEPENPVCEDTVLTNGPYIYADGVTVDIDPADDASITNLYDEGTVCYTYEVTFTDDTHTGTLVAAVESGTIEIDVNETLSTGVQSASGNPASLDLDSHATYTGEMCWSDYDEGSYIELYIEGEDVCEIDDTLPTVTDEPENPVCEDTVLTNGPYIYADGVTVDIDPDDDTSITNLYDEGTVCYTYQVDFTDNTHTGTLVASAESGTIEIDVNETLSTGLQSTSGNPASIDLDGHAIYTGEMCWSDYTEGSYIELYIEGEDVCEIDDTLPTIEPEGDDDDDDDSSGGGGGGGSTCWQTEFEDLDGDELDEDDFVEGEDTEFCIDINSTKRNQDVVISYSCGEEDENSCIEFDFNEDGVIDYDDPEEYSCDGTLTIEDLDKSLDTCGTFTNVCEDLHIEVSVDSSTRACYDEIEVELDPGVCEEVTFDDPAFTPGDNYETCVEIDSSLSEQTLVVEYDNCGDEACVEVDLDGDGEISDDEQFCGDEDFIQEITEEFSTGEDTYEVCMEFTNTCEDAEITTYIEDHEDTCYEEAIVQNLGEFDKFIFTFNFSVEKSPYTDNDIFFTHDEDRVFYTLEYTPSDTLTEDSITFRDEMWDELSDGIPGTLGDGSEGGEVVLATSEEELTSGESYTYSLITNMGFGTDGNNGTLYEENSANIAGQNSDYSGLTANDLIKDGYVYIPYVKYDSDFFTDEETPESEIIPECEYEEVLDDDGNPTGEEELSSESICHDPNYSPDAGSSSERKVTIENVGTLDEGATIRIRYVGVVQSGLDCDNSADDCLTEEFRNTASVWLYEGTESLEAEARLINLCAYLVTRNAGDVYLEIPLTGGSDIACIFSDEDYNYSDSYRNVDALVITPPSSTTSSSTSADDILNTYYSSTISVCDNTESENNVVENISSYICEIVVEVTDLWKGDSIEMETQGRVSQASLNALTNQTSETNEFANNGISSAWTQLSGTLSNLNNSESGIFYFDGDKSSTGSLTIGDMTIAEDTGYGAYTVVVENADLIIEGNIQYAATTDPTNAPSIAFIVTGGDIIVSGSAYNLVGVYYTDQVVTVPEGTERSAVNQPLTIYGSVYGYVQPLLDASNYVGSPLDDGGNVSFYYSSLIILNTPPILEEYVDVATEKALN